MPIIKLLLSSLLTLGLVSSLGAYTVGSNYQVTVLAENISTYEFTQYEGISKSGNTLYMGNYNTIKQFNLTTGVLSDYSSFPGNNGISHVTYANGKIYASAYTSSGAPYPYTMYSVSQGGTASTVLDMDGIFDARTSPTGDFYFVANPDVDEDGEGDGTRLYRLNYSNNSVTEVAYFGGLSGGIAFDAEGNLFYSHYDNNAVYRFAAEDLLTGGLEITNDTEALALENPGYLDFNSKGQLVASRLNDDWETIISIYDFASKQLIEEIFQTNSDNAEGMGGFLVDGDDIYVILQNFGGDYGSQLLALTSVPEPATYAFAFALVAAGVVWRRRAAK